MLEIYKDKKVFLTGHTGFKGSWLSLWLSTLGARVWGYSLLPNTTPNHFDLLKAKDELLERNFFADICDIINLEKALSECEPDIIFHLAAQPLVRYSYKEPFETFNTNAIGTLNILNLARKLKNLKAIVIITTDKVYENKEWLWGYRENDVLGGIDPYSASKACAEIITNSMRESFFNLANFNKTHQVLIATARAGNVIGGGDYSCDRLLPDLVYGVLAKQKALIRNPSATRPWQLVLEPLRAYLMLGERLLKGESNFATSFNFGPNVDGNLSVSEVLEIAKKAWDKIEFDIKIDKNAPHEATLLMLDNTKAKKMLGIKPILNAQEAINLSIKWYKAYHENSEILSKNMLLDFIKRENNG